MKWDHCKCCTLRSWPKFSRSHIWNVTFSETVRAIAKMRYMTFVEVDIRRRMAPLWILYSVILNFIFKVKLFCYAFAVKNSQSVDITGRFASTRTAPAAELFWLLLIDASNALAYSIVWSRLDYCNALHLGASRKTADFSESRTSSHSPFSTSLYPNYTTTMNLDESRWICIL